MKEESGGNQSGVNGAFNGAGEGTINRKEVHGQNGGNKKTIDHLSRFISEREGESD